MNEDNEDIVTGETRSARFQKALENLRNEIPNISAAVIRTLELDDSLTPNHLRQICRLVKDGVACEEAVRIVHDIKPKRKKLFHILRKHRRAQTRQARTEEKLASGTFNFEEQLQRLSPSQTNKVMSMLDNGFTEREAIELTRKLMDENWAQGAIPIPVRVVHEKYPRTALTPTEMTKVKDLITSTLRRMTAEGNRMKPLLGEQIAVGGYLLIICFNAQTVRWVQGRMAKVPWSRFRIRTITQKDQMKSVVKSSKKEKQSVRSIETPIFPTSHSDVTFPPPRNSNQRSGENHEQLQRRSAVNPAKRREICESSRSTDRGMFHTNDPHADQNSPNDFFENLADSHSQDRQFDPLTTDNRADDFEQDQFNDHRSEGLRGAVSQYNQNRNFSNVFRMDEGRFCGLAEQSDRMDHVTNRFSDESYNRRDQRLSNDIFESNGRNQFRERNYDRFQGREEGQSYSRRYEVDDDDPYNRRDQRIVGDLVERHESDKRSDFKGDDRRYEGLSEKSDPGYRSHHTSNDLIEAIGTGHSRDRRYDGFDRTHDRDVNQLNDKQMGHDNDLHGRNEHRERAIRSAFDTLSNQLTELGGTSDRIIADQCRTGFDNRGDSRERIDHGTRGQERHVDDRSEYRERVIRFAWDKSPTRLSEFHNRGDSNDHGLYEQQRHGDERYRHNEQRVRDNPFARSSSPNRFERFAETSDQMGEQRARHLRSNEFVEHDNIRDGRKLYDRIPDYESGMLSDNCLRDQQFSTNPSDRRGNRVYGNNFGNRYDKFGDNYSARRD